MTSTQEIFDFTEALIEGSKPLYEIVQGAEGYAMFLNMSEPDGRGFQLEKLEFGHVVVENIVVPGAEAHGPLLIPSSADGLFDELAGREVSELISATALYFLAGGLRHRGLEWYEIPNEVQDSFLSAYERSDLAVDLEDLWSRS